MAGRIRTIKPEILSDSKAARLSDAAWRLWVSTWTLADDEGRFPCDPVWLCGQVFWSHPCDCDPLLAELERGGFIKRYVANGDPFAEISGWKKHQKINRPSGARYPQPSTFTEPSVSPHGTVTEGSLPSTTTIDHRPSTSITAAAPPARESFDVEAIYALYPRKGDGKAAGLERLRKQIKTRDEYEQALRAARHYAEKCDAEQTPLKYVKRFDTWCNRHWRDYVDGPHVASKPKGAAGKQNWTEPMQHRAETKDETDDL